MSYKIIVDSCGEFTERLKEDKHFVNVPLQLQVDDHIIVDDEFFDQADFLKKVAASPNCPKSSCPSPEKYMQEFTTDAEDVYAVTLSSQLSGSYNSAVLGKNLYHEEKGNKNIHVFDSKSASIGETLIALKAEECETAGMGFHDVVRTVEEYIENMHTYFVLESLETLRKNGRLSNLKAFVAGALNIKPVMGATSEGSICQLGQARGINKALDKMMNIIVEQVKDSENKILAISHCNCPERALMVKEELLKKCKFKDIILCETAGVSTLYANDGGIIAVV
ncbi:DegV family protein with EDD domain [Lachnotalea glycerini]|jgi:DegV family protein with EDD domain|uniref:DegV family protein n=1 Tax=Lachnotalea glycerini TaxID=1763509 RepID=A0A255K4X6_9FIRM|nr:DegV family protein [Lachnotalea glycerini]OYO59709.1 dihydroxyacetone kinase [Lachnotalea glycerini]PXV88280.1 DegV family protein with EDD domain [Lachnotalea glycerini]RDY30862.1 DegV family protein [Lachnotalea glycerini]